MRLAHFGLLTISVVASSFASTVLVHETERAQAAPSPTTTMLHQLNRRNDTLFRQCQRNTDLHEVILSCSAIIQNPAMLLSGDARGAALSAIYTDRGMAYLRSGDNDRAIADLDQAIQLDPKNSRAFDLRGELFLVKGDPGLALQEYDRAVAANPKDFEAFNQRGNFYLRVDRPVEAVADYDKALALNGRSVSVYTNRGAAYGAQGQLDRAIADLNKAISLDAKFPAAYDSRGLAYTAQHDYDRAAKDFDTALQLAPDSVVVLGHRAVMFSAKGDLMRALADFDLVVKLDPNPSAFVNRGVAYQKAGQYGPAIRDLSEALKANPDYAVALYYRGLARQSSEDIVGGDADIAQARALDPNVGK